MPDKSIIHGEVNVQIGKGIGKSIGKAFAALLDSPKRQKSRADAGRHERLTDAQTTQDVHAIHDGLLEYRDDNLREVATITRPLLPEPTSLHFDEIDPLWASMWFDKASYASDSRIQLLWAKILAGEAESPGKFSKFALEAVGNMDQSDIQAFNQFFAFCWDLGPVVWQDSPYRPTANIHLKLERAGLVHFNEFSVSQHSIRDFMGGLTYFGERFLLCAPDNCDGLLPIGMARLTATGTELLSLCQGSPDVQYRDDCLERWKKEGFHTVSRYRGPLASDILGQINKLKWEDRRKIAQERVIRVTQQEYDVLVEHDRIKQDKMYVILAR